MRNIIRSNMKRELAKWKKETGTSSKTMKEHFKTPFAFNKKGEIFYKRFKCTLHNMVCLAFDANWLMK